MKHSVIGIFLSSSFLMVILFATGIEAQATIRRVPADYPTIQQAINASVNGDTVSVAPGTYVENIDFLGKAITVTSEAGPELTIIDGNRAGSVVTFRSGEGRASTISGFTIRNGLATFDFRYTGGGINLWHSSATIRNNVIRNNLGAATGGGIGIEVGSPLIEGNTITDNHTIFSGTLGGGILISFSSDVQVLNNLISNNSADSGGGIYVYLAQAITIRNNVLEGNGALNWGGGIYLGGGYPTFSVVQNIFRHNTAARGGGILWQVGGGELLNNTVADNSSLEGSGIYAYAYDSQTQWINNIIVAQTGQIGLFCGPGNSESPLLRSNNIFSPGGVPYAGSCQNQTGINGNISADPLFVNPLVGDYHLRSGSPSIDAGDNSAPNLPATDLDANPRIQDGNGDGLAIVDMGAYEASLPTPPFDICIQDDSTGNIFKFNSTTGDYQFRNCSGFSLSGLGSLIQRGSVITLQHYASDRRVLARIDTSVNKATASIQLFSPSITFTITDRNTANNTCACTPN